MSKYVIMEGNAISDAELRYTQSGKAMASVTVACSERTKTDGEWTDDETLFVRITQFDKQAENLAASVRKGDAVVFAGRLAGKSYTSKQTGEVRTGYECIPDNIGLSLRWRTATAGAKTQGQQRPQQAAQGEQWAQPQATNTQTPF